MIRREFATDEEQVAMKRQMKVKTEKGRQAEHRKRTGTSDTKEEEHIKQSMRRKWIARAYLTVRQLERGERLKDIRKTKMGKRLEAHVWLIEGPNKHQKVKREEMCKDGEGDGAVRLATGTEKDCKSGESTIAHADTHSDNNRTAVMCSKESEG